MQEARDPSYLVAQPLQNHVHLISGHRFPQLPSLNIEQALRYLVDAPTIVKQTAPMAWQYIQYPQAGTAWLEWISMRNGQNRYASDGFVWGDAEQTFQKEFGGYTIEGMTHTIGYRPGIDHTASHARTRFHFIAKNPSINAPPPDPSLWIVHYHQADHSRMLPAAQIPVAAHVRQQQTERKWLEAQGRLERKDFMLHDRDHWPTITLPNAGMQMQQQQHAMHQQQQQQQAMYGHPAMMQQHMTAAGVPRFPQQHHPQAQAPPAKRARHTGPTAMPGPSEAAHDNSIEDEEAQLLDYFDHLTPRDISKARYEQHHRWMEEVFNSPYASTAIVPPDLGLGLMGELKGLTEGILNPPSVNDIKDIESRPREAAKEAQPFTNLSKEQLDEFNRRVEKHLADGQAEIERMKKDHAEKMAEWKKSKALLQAEKRLRYATWEGHESAVPAAYRLEIPPEQNGHVEEGVKRETVEEVVKDVESLLGTKIKAHKDATMIRRGGLEKQEEKRSQSVQEPGAHAQNAALDVAGKAPSGLQPGQPDVPPQSHPQTSSSAAPVDPAPQTMQSEPLDQMQDQPDNLDEFVMGEAEGDDAMDDMEGMDVGDTSLMDMDVDTGDIDFVQHDEDEFGDTSITPAATATNDPPPPTEPQSATEQAGNAVINQANAPQPSTSQSLPQGELELQPRAEESAIPALAADASLGNEPDVSANIEPASTAPAASTLPAPVPLDTAENNPAANNDDENDIFGDGTFDDLPEMVGNEDDDDHADGLLDFDGGMGMQDTAFGDAMHGMDESGTTPNVLADEGGDSAAGGGMGDGARESGQS